MTKSLQQSCHGFLNSSSWNNKWKKNAYNVFTSAILFFKILDKNQIYVVVDLEHFSQFHRQFR